MVEATTPSCEQRQTRFQRCSASRLLGGPASGPSDVAPRQSARSSLTKPFRMAWLGWRIQSCREPGVKARKPKASDRALAVCSNTTTVKPRSTYRCKSFNAGALRTLSNDSQPMARTCRSRGNGLSGSSFGILMPAREKASVVLPAVSSRPHDRKDAFRLARGG